MNKDKYYNIKIMNKGYGKTYHEMQQLITNLQHQISLMKEDIREVKEINGELQQENERLKETIKHYEDTTTFGDYVKEVNLLIDYKSRCEKAIEFINISDLSYFKNEEILLNILQDGSDK